MALVIKRLQIEVDFTLAETRESLSEWAVFFLFSLDSFLQVPVLCFWSCQLAPVTFIQSAVCESSGI